MPRQFNPAEIQLAKNNLVKARALIETAAGTFLDLGSVLSTLEKEVAEGEVRAEGV